jgi:hypothetical protein
MEQVVVIPTGFESPFVGAGFGTFLISVRIDGHASGLSVLQYIACTREVEVSAEPTSRASIYERRNECQACC